MAWSWIDGRLMPDAEARVAVLDRGFQYGDGIFETLLLRGGKPILFPGHVQRMRAAAAALELDLPYDGASLRRAVDELAEANAIESGVVRLTLSRGVGARGLAAGDGLQPTLVMTAAAGIPYEEACYTHGLGAVLIPWPRNEHSPLVAIKALSCLENVLGARFARRAGAREGLFLNTAGRLAEGTMSNLFTVKDGEISTPPVEEGLLPGVTRGFLLARGPWPAVERPLSLEDLMAADEAFLTNAVLGVAPLVQVDGRPIAHGEPGPLTRLVRGWYNKEIMLQDG